MPESQNDMIFSIICEELGLLGVVCVILPLLYLCWQMLKITLKADTKFASVMTLGIFFHVALQSFINIAVTVNVLPNTGIGLPFISYGGTAVFCQLFEMAIVLSVCRRIQKKGEKSNDK